MNCINVAIVDDNEKMAVFMERLLKEEEGINVVGRADNGAAGINLIRESKPDVVLLDLVMPQLDGFQVLSRVRSDGTILKKPAFIVVSAVGQESVTERAFNSGADYFMMKPFEHSSVVNTVREVYASASERLSENASAEWVYLNTRMEKDVSEYLKKLGIPAHLRGYLFLRDAVLVVMKEPDTLNSVTKAVYPEVAKKYKINSIRIERAIRHVIDKAWEEHESTIREMLLGNAGKGKHGKPTNAQLIALISDHLRMNSQVGC